ncbi:MAG: HAD hydrolase-like protein [Paracoccaceae bacterium]
MIERIIKAYIFYVDGTIAETEGIHLQAFNEAFKEFKVAWNWSKPTYKPLLEIAGSENRIRYFNSQTKSNFSNDLIRELVKQKQKSIRTNY